jgi:CTP synthase
MQEAMQDATTKQQQQQQQQKDKKFIFVTGGVLSSLGKGTAAASLGLLLEARGINLTLIKMDPYLNVDPGTMSPFQHGEVYVLDDGAETDLDLGHYSRFVRNVQFSRKNSFTTGRIYDSVIRKERSGAYLGKTVQVIPHITDEIKLFIDQAAQDADLAIVEVGGTVGDIESLPFLEAIRQMRVQFGAKNVIFVHLTLVMFIQTAGELKTKPTQHSVKELREIGIQPDILLCRSDRELPLDVKEKIGLFCSIPVNQVFTAPDVESIYDLPLMFSQQGLDEKIMEMLGVWTSSPDLTAWKGFVDRFHQIHRSIDIGVVGKYADWKNSYKSLAEALIHAGCVHQVHINVVFFDAQQIEDQALNRDIFIKLDGVLIPGGFGVRGVEGKMEAIRFARENKIPFLGICLGMQLAVIEFARQVANLRHASSAEFTEHHEQNVVDLMKSQENVEGLGGSMRLGSFDCEIEQLHRGVVTKAFQAYGQTHIAERHRHRYEVAGHFVAQLEAAGLIISGKHYLAEGFLAEIIELPDHPWFVGCQFHPEFKSHPLKTHPLIEAFVHACVQQSSLKMRLDQRVVS